MFAILVGMETAAIIALAIVAIAAIGWIGDAIIMRKIRRREKERGEPF